MTVWILIAFYNNEGYDEPKAVYDSKEKAEKALAEKKNLAYEIIEMIVE